MSENTGLNDILDTLQSLVEECYKEINAYEKKDEKPNANEKEASKGPEVKECKCEKSQVISDERLRKINERIVALEASSDCDCNLISNLDGRLQDVEEEVYTTTDDKISTLRREVKSLQALQEEIKEEIKDLRNFLENREVKKEEEKKNREDSFSDSVSIAYYCY